MKGKRKILSIFISTLVIASSISLLSFQESIRVKATGGYQQGAVEGLNYSYMWDVTTNLSNAVHYAYNHTDIKKGRTFGSKGCEIYSRDYIKNQMMNLSLDSVKPIQLGPIRDLLYVRRHYTSLVNVNNFQLTINNPNYQTETGYNPNIPKNETYAIASTMPDYLFQGLGDGLTNNFTFSINKNIVATVPLSPSWPTGGSLTGDFLNVSCQSANGCNIVVGNVTYIGENDPLPQDQVNRIFLINEVEGCQAKIENAANCSAVILIHDNVKGYSLSNSILENASSPIVRVDSTNNNLINITERLERGEYIVADNVQNNSIVTFTLNSTLSSIEWPDHNFVVLINTTDNQVHGSSNWLVQISAYLRAVSIFHPLKRCYGFIFYSDKSDGTHQMLWYSIDWFRLADGISIRYPSLPVFSVNHSVGSFLVNHSGYNENTICGFINQTYMKEEHIGINTSRWTTGVNAWDVEGHINITKNPGNKIVVISNRQDSYWGECPGDSGAGAGMVLTIAKYFKDYNIKPKYNLTFLQTTGEENGYRGAQYWSDKHKDDNIILYIGFDQLGMNQSNTKLELDYSSNLTRRIVWAIANDTHYTERTNYNIVHNQADNYHRKSSNQKDKETGSDPWLGHFTEDVVWMQRDYRIPKSATTCDTICFSKDSNWLHHHQTGSNFKEGDSLKNENRKDLNITLELGWNVTKYFTVNPNCWFSTTNYQAFDSNGGTIPDSIKATLTIKSILPSDLVLVNASLYDASTEQIVPGAYQEMNLTINRNGVEHNVTFSMPAGVKEGDYYIKLKVYNSTARINKTLGYTYSSNDTEISPMFHLNKYHTLGDIRIGTQSKSTSNIIRGSRFTPTENCLVWNITAYVSGGYNPAPTYQCLIYRVSDGQLIGASNQAYAGTAEWRTFTFPQKPILLKNTQYMLCIWGNSQNAHVYATPTTYANSYQNSSCVFGNPPQHITWDWVAGLNQLSIFCHYTLNLPPEIINVSNSPNTVGFGYNVTINANVTDDYNNTIVKVNITNPNQTYGNYTMNHITGSQYRYVLSNTWTVGQYNYSVWAIDNASNVDSSTGHHFNVSAYTTMSIATLKDSYTGNQYINITDPPNPPENYTLIGRGLTWNTYYDASSGNNILEAYQGPTNYQENNGSWTPINNSFYPLSSNHPAYNYGYRTGNTHGLFGVYFKQDISSNWPVVFAYNRSSNPTTSVIRSKLVGVGYLDPQSNWAYHYLQSVQSSQGQTNGDTITYPSAFTGTDVSWRYRNTELKEAITLSNSTKTMLQNHPPSQYGLSDASSYLVFITKLDYQNLNLYNTSGMLTGNVTITDTGVDFKDVLGQFKCGLPVGEAWEKNNESVREKLMYRVVHLNGDTYLLSGLRVSDLNAMIFPVVIDPTLTVYSRSSDGHINKSDSNYNTARTASTGTVSNSASFLSIGQVKNTSGTPSKTYTIYRGFVFFNTSSLPSNAYLDSANLSLYKKDDFSATDFDITIQNGQPTYPHEPMQSGDYNLNYYSGNGGTLNTRNLQNGYNKISLTNLNWINRNGITKLCLRSSRDINGNAPTGNEYVNMYSNEQGIGYQPKLVIIYRNQSKIKNTGLTNIKGYLLIQIQFYNSTQGKWLVDKDTINETSPRAITSGNQLAFDTIFNGHVRASDLTHGTGTYRVYAAFRDPNGNILKTSSGVWLNAWWQFTKT